jgi:uncharacterized protein YcbX
MSAPCLASITVFPIKSLDGHELLQAEVLPGAGLHYDRRWRLVDMEGRVVNAKRTPLIQAVRAAFDLEQRQVTLSSEQLTAETFPLQPGTRGPCGWLAEAVGMPVLLEERADGFPDDRDAPGPTLISTATLITVAGWFGLTTEEARRRFRSNLEISDTDAFFEDTLASPAVRLVPGSQGGGLQPFTAGKDAPPPPVDPYADLPPPQPQPFSLGPVRLVATGVCRRCVVPTRKSHSGEAEMGFRESFEARRRSTLRRDVDASSWNGFYRLGLNTRVLAAGRMQCGVALQPPR